MTKVENDYVSITLRVMSRAFQTAEFQLESQPLWSTRLVTRSDDGYVEAVRDTSKSAMTLTDETPQESLFVLPICNIVAWRLSNKTDSVQTKPWGFQNVAQAARL